MGRNTDLKLRIRVLLLYASKDLWKEWGDKFFQIFLQVHHGRLESLVHLIVLFIYHSKHYGIFSRLPESC